MCSMVDFVYLSEIITILSLQVFICLYLCKDYFNDLEFGDLIDNQNHNIHIIGSWIISRSHVLF
jgi:hypothetical protein